MAGNIDCKPEAAWEKSECEILNEEQMILNSDQNFQITAQTQQCRKPEQIQQKVLVFKTKSLGLTENIFFPGIFDMPNLEVLELQGGKDPKHLFGNQVMFQGKGSWVD